MLPPLTVTRLTTGFEDFQHFSLVFVAGDDPEVLLPPIHGFRLMDQQVMQIAERLEKKGMIGEFIRFLPEETQSLLHPAAFHFMKPRLPIVSPQVSVSFHWLARPMSAATPVPVANQLPG
jgi:hypothetical protein